VTVSASHLRRQTTSSSTSVPLAATRGAESEHGSPWPLADVVRIVSNSTGEGWRFLLFRQHLGHQSASISLVVVEYFLVGS
jgi:hypothetical protein